MDKARNRLSKFTIDTAHCAPDEIDIYDICDIKIYPFHFVLILSFENPLRITVELSLQLRFVGNSIA